jgi:HlyD family secretion protein
MAISNIKKIVFVAVIVIIVVVAMAVGIRLSGVNEPVIEGVVEARTYRASSKIAGRIDSLFVSEGDWVKQGELLYTISTPELQAKLDQVEALRAAAEAINKEVDGGARKEQIDAAKSMWQKAIAGEELAKKSYARVKNLMTKVWLHANNMMRHWLRIRLCALRPRRRELPMISPLKVLHKSRRKLLLPRCARPRVQFVR